MKKIRLSFIEQAALAGGVSESLHSNWGGGGLGGRGGECMQTLWIEKVGSVVLGFEHSISHIGSPQDEPHVQISLVPVQNTSR